MTSSVHADIICPRDRAENWRRLNTTAVPMTDHEIEMVLVALDAAGTDRSKATAEALRFRMEHLAKDEAQLNAMAEAIKGKHDSRDVCWAQVRIRPMACVEFRAHGSFGADAEIRAMADEMRAALAFSELNSVGREVAVRSQIWCG